MDKNEVAFQLTKLLLKSYGLDLSSKNKTSEDYKEVLSEQMAGLYNSVYKKLIIED